MIGTEQLGPHPPGCGLFSSPSIQRLDSRATQWSSGLRIYCIDKQNPTQPRRVGGVAHFPGVSDYWGVGVVPGEAGFVPGAVDGLEPGTVAGFVPGVAGFVLGVVGFVPGAGVVDGLEPG
jgi:hypothetical protein